MNSSPLSNHLIFITGATSGFGKACAKLLASYGAKLILTGRRYEKLVELQNELGADKIHIAELDVTQKDAVQKVITELPAAFSPITVLINNAGLSLGMELAQNCSLDDWSHVVDTNIKGVLHCTHGILPTMVANNNGHIINIGSIAGTYPYPGGNVYGATKAFVKQFSLNLRADLFGTSIRVTNVEPGLAETEFSIVRFKGDMEKAKSLYAGTNPITAEDIAETVFWCLNRPSHININSVEVMPTCQSFGMFAIDRSI
ncbi:MAG: SDR family oxidoreductase [Alphaproteobacteria bacterium]|jgi:3-hydroxy acid dehydrogenase / malonic semialdehyde reductase|nr:SDR family oxidoreductase [Alphaproteobacteria bacterium]